MTARRVVLVGNAKVEVDHTNLVDDSEHVIRMNDCGNYGINTGTRTTILGLINIGVVGRDHYKKKNLADRRPVLDATEIWFRWWKLGPIDVLRAVLRHPLKRKQHLDYGQKLVLANNLSDKRIVYASRPLVARARKLLRQVDPGRPWKRVVPTSGFLLLQRVFADPRFAGCEICLVGFDWEIGTSRRTYRDQHTWDEEETLCRQYESEGRLRILPCVQP
jgi:hypothetical protein